MLLFFSYTRLFSRISSLSTSHFLSKNCMATQRIGLIQLTSTSNKADNFDKCARLIEQGKRDGANIIFLPECFDFIGESVAQSLELAESIDGPLVSEYRLLAKQHNVYLSLGGFHNKDPRREDGRLTNCHILISGDGEIVSTYNKLHLCDFNISGRVTLQESRSTAGGSSIVPPVSTPVGNIGLAICYDLRFPELSSALRSMGADILTYPSAFSVPTGEAHWHLLLKARAIETRCFVVAAAQTGQHNAKRASYGHSLVVDPRGRILADCCDDVAGEGSERLVIVDLDMEDLQRVRQRDAQRHGDHVTLESMKKTVDIGHDGFQYDQEVIPSEAIFYKTNTVVAFLSSRPICPGHTLICPIRQSVPLADDLSRLELAQLYGTIQIICPALKSHYKATAFNFSQQNGHWAGQDIKHFHIHVVPRKAGDIERNDEIYPMLFDHDKKTTTKTELSIAQLKTQSDALRSKFYN